MLRHPPGFNGFLRRNQKKDLSKYWPNVNKSCIRRFETCPVVPTKLDKASGSSRGFFIYDIASLVAHHDASGGSQVRILSARLKNETLQMIEFEGFLNFNNIKSIKGDKHYCSPF
jgi:hypothetical protein